MPDNGKSLKGESPGHPPNEQSQPENPEKKPGERGLLGLAAELKNLIRRDRMHRSKRTRASR